MSLSCVRVLSPLLRWRAAGSWGPAASLALMPFSPTHSDCAYRFDWVTFADRKKPALLFPRFVPCSRFASCARASKYSHSPSLPSFPHLPLYRAHVLQVCPAPAELHHYNTSALILCVLQWFSHLCGCLPTTVQRPTGPTPLFAPSRTCVTLY